MAGDRVHMTCEKKEKQYSNCQAACDKDRQCKGFVLNKILLMDHYCVLATTAKCSKGWKLRNGWATGGPLSPHSKCNKGFGYKGCFIKNTGKLTISIICVDN